MLETIFSADCVIIVIYRELKQFSPMRLQKIQDNSNELYYYSEEGNCFAFVH